MGIYSDILEDCRDTVFFDPCMYVNNVNYENVSHINIYHRTKSISPEPIEAHVSTQSSRDYQSEYEIYEIIRTKCEAQERIILSIKNTLELESDIMKEIIEELICIVENTYRSSNKAICDIQNNAHIKTISVKIDNDFEKSALLETITSNVFKTISSDNIVDSSAFRHLVYDTSKILMKFGYYCESNNKKAIFKEYMKSKYNIQTTLCRCMNCDCNLYEKINFCLNCFERC